MHSITRFNRTSKQDLLVDESIFALQNGMIGVRGNFAEGYHETDYKQTLINGFYNTYDYHYEENSPAFPQVGQRLINVIDGQSIDCFINGNRLDMTQATLVKLERTFDLLKGYTSREATYQTKEGYTIFIKERKMVSFIQKELLLIDLEISSPDYAGDITLVSKLTLPNLGVTETHDSRINIPKERQLTILEKHLNHSQGTLVAKTKASNLPLVVGMTHNLTMDYQSAELGITATYQGTLKHPVHLEKQVIYTAHKTLDQLIEYNDACIKQCVKTSFDTWATRQEAYLRDFWTPIDINLDDNELFNRDVLYNIYQLNASYDNDPFKSIPAKGLTGEGYEGHYFWDTEIYMIPFFTITNPEKAKNLLMYRYHHLKEAKEIAKSHGASKGAKIPWRTINGYEVSPYYPAGSAQYHINSDVAYALIKYVEYTKDIDFLIDYGFEILLETGRFLLDVGNFVDGVFHINNVTGPDEYTAIVNNNYYTNTMAKYHFEQIVKLFKKHRNKLSKVIEKTTLLEKEISAFSKAAKAMKLTIDHQQSIVLQDDSFAQKAALDLTSLDPDKFPLILHYHPLFVYKHQVIKQADVLLSMFLLDFEDITMYQNSFDYYLPMTSHDSSLSKCIHSIVALRLNRLDLGYEYFQDILHIDMENTHKNTHHGLHIANAGGIYLTLLYGFLGFRIKEDGIIFRPHLPTQMKHFSFQLTYLDTLIKITLNDQITIQVSQPITLGIYDERILIEKSYHCDYK